MSGYRPHTDRVVRSEPMSPEEREARFDAWEWLLRAAKDRKSAEREWGPTGGPALLQAGKVFDVLRVTYHALGLRLPDPKSGPPLPMSRTDLIDRLGVLGITGMVYRSDYRPYLHFLVPPGTDQNWPKTLLLRDQADCAGGSYADVHLVGLPSPNSLEGPHLHWVRPFGPGGPAAWLADPEHLRTVLVERAEAAV